MKIAVTGTTGQLGSAVLEALVNREFDTFSLDRNGLDLIRITSIHESLSGFDPDVIINCAAFTSVDDSEMRTEYAFAINAVAPTELAKYCYQNEIKFIQISTDSVFSSTSPFFFQPFDPPAPVNVYSKSKLLGEIGVMREHPIGATIIRTSWLFSQGANKFVQAITKQGRAGQTFKVVNDQFGQPTSAKSLAEFIVFLITTDSVNGIYHLASSNYLSRYEFARSILEKFRLDSDLVIPCATVSSVGIAERPKYSLLDVSESSMNGYTGITIWEQELERFFDSVTGDQ
jgi:dTDP-4-dehydrorhamnose reductase